MNELISNGLSKSLDQIYRGFLERPTKVANDSISLSERQSLPTPMKLYSAQNFLRPLFGKDAPKPPSFGDHPDYAYLKQTRGKQFGAITTLFMDLESSTRLGLLYEPEEV